MISLITKKPYKYPGSAVVNDKLVIPWELDKIDEHGLHPVVIAVVIERFVEEARVFEDIKNAWSFAQYPVTGPTELTINGLDDNIVEITLLVI